ncbi:MAG: glutamine-hydrolyzing carbamoyl-phosphate synthase small subunit [Lachnospiraceae bacterium]|nr:glutamine-hydrolyzing carbamoyl-phosphate synthase small subunit [Lachnospiraceae bacterium]
MKRKCDRQIILEDGTHYSGCGFGDLQDKILEIVFNTSMVGYQEILSDPSYTDQAVVMTYPLIGNYGMADEDYETDRPTIGALIVHEYNDEPSNFRSTASLGDVMKKYGIAGISGVDTRKLNRSIRDFGTRKCLITDIETPLEEGLKKLRNFSAPVYAVSRVSSKEIWRSPACNAQAPSPAPFHVVLIDCGMKKNILRSLNRRGCDVTVVPWNTTSEVVCSLRPDGVLISNGPGDPTDVPETIETVRALRGRCPIFGICLGHQILSLAYGARTYKLKFGHRGGNHPVRDLQSGRIEITSQNHSYAVDVKSLAQTGLEVTHVNILDGTIEGVKCGKDNAFSVQYHPESAPGPQDSAYLFDRFIALMRAAKSNAAPGEKLVPESDKEVSHAQAN